MAARRKRTFGSVRRLPSGRYQARYTGPDGHTHKAPGTFSTRTAADKWLSERSTDMERGEWTPAAPRSAPKLLGPYADDWLAGRDLKPRTRAHYRAILDDHVLPTFAAVPITSITPVDVREWHVRLGKDTGPTARAHAYSLLRTILATAVADDLIPTSPCRIRGAGNAKRAVKIRPASLAELAAIVEAMPARYRAMVLLASWCALRFGELAELRRKDVDLKGQVVHVRRGVVRADGEVIVGDPKSEAGARDVAIPPHLIPVLREHLADHAERGRDGLLFPARGGGHLATSSLYRVFHRARAVAGRPDLRFHDLRHTGAVLAAATGATLAELMARLGHSTPGAAMRYQHAAADRDQAIAAALSELAAGTVIPLHRRAAVEAE